jgi:hypothetical protein
MKKQLKYSVLSALILGSSSMFAGNPERAGQAGGAELQINPFTRSSGWGMANTTGVRGLEATYLNIAGLAGVRKTELLYSRMNYVADIKINTFGFAHKLGGENGSSAISIGLTSFNFGDIKRTTVDQPDGGLGTYNVSTSILGLGYANRFTDKIYGGVLFKLYSQGTADVKANALSMDAGVQYATTTNPSSVKQNDLRFAVAVKDIGPDYTPGGDGLSIKSTLTGRDFQSTTSLRAAKIELPTSVNIGMAYDFQLDKDKELYRNRLTAAFNFTNNSYSRNQTSIGLEYAYNELFMVRSGFIYENGMFGDIGPDGRTSFFTGYNFGISAEPSISKENGNSIAIDLSYRTTNPFGGVLGLGLRINFADTKREASKKVAIK